MLSRFCTGLYRFFTWPFRKIYECFAVREREILSLTESVTSPRTPEAKLSPKIYMRRKPQKEKEQELQGKVHFRPLFLPDHFNASNNSKNDAEFKSNTEQSKKKKERIKARKAIMKVLKEMEEMEKMEQYKEDAIKKSKQKNPVNITDPKNKLT